jgi:hypothetical protein
MIFNKINDKNKMIMLIIIIKSKFKIYIIWYLKIRYKMIFINKNNLKI